MHLPTGERKGPSVVSEPKPHPLTRQSSHPRPGHWTPCSTLPGGEPVGGRFLGAPQGSRPLPPGGIDANTC